MAPTSKEKTGSSIKFASSHEFQAWTSSCVVLLTTVTEYPASRRARRATPPAARAVGITGGYHGFVEIEENGCVGARAAEGRRVATQPVAYQHLRSKKVLCRHVRLLQNGRRCPPASLQSDWEWWFDVE